MKHFTRGTLLATLFIATILASAPAIVSAFGVSPPYVHAPVLRKGSQFTSTIFLVQGDPKVDLRVKAVFEVPEKIKGWLSVDKGSEFTIPAGLQQFPIKVFINVPKDAENGIFTGYLRVNTLPNRTAGEQIAISVGARIDISLTVGENVISDFSIRRLDILDIQQNENPQVIVTLDNTGNVPAAPERASFELFDKYGQIRLGYAAIEKFPETAAFQSSDFTMEFPVDIRLSIGEYWGDVKLYRGKEVVKELRTVFNVTERKVDYVVYGGVLVALIAIGALFFVVSRVRRRTLTAHGA
ncbi:MAG: hypothetical protein Q7S84_01590 [bacterium]|nr:hypothetical protein [bacterium]